MLRPRIVERLMLLMERYPRYGQDLAVERDSWPVILSFLFQIEFEKSIMMGSYYGFKLDIKSKGAQGIISHPFTKKKV